MANRIFIEMILCNISAMICFSIVAPILPIELKDTDLEKELFGYMFAAYSIPSILGSLICGEILSKCGRRIVLFFSVVAMGISTILFGWVNIISSKETLIFFVCGIRAIEGLSSGFIYCAVYSVISITFRENQVKYLAYVEASEAITMILGPAVGSSMYQLFGFELVFCIIGAFEFIVAISIMLIIPKEIDINDDSLLVESNESNQILRSYEQMNQLNINQNKESKEIGNEHSTKLVTGELHTNFSVGYLKLLCNPIILITAITCFLSCFEYCYLEPIFALRLDEMGLNNFEIGIFFCIFGTSYTISTFAVSYFTDRFDIRGIIWKSMILCGFINFFVGPSIFLPNSIIIMGIGQFLNGILEVFFMTTCLPVMIEEGEKAYPNNKIEVADKASGIASCMFDLGQALGPLYGSYVSSFIGFRNTADSISIILIGYSVIFFLVLIYAPPHMKDNSDNSLNFQTKSIENIS